MKFAELSTGQRIVMGPVTVDREEVFEFAAKYDPQWFHTDAERAAAGPWGGLIASGWHTCGLAMALVDKHILEGSETFGSPGLSYLKWLNPVRPGDQLMLEVEVLEKRVSSSKPDLGIVRWRWVMSNQDGAAVLDVEATSLFRLQTT